MPPIEPPKPDVSTPQPDPQPPQRPVDPDAPKDTLPAAERAKRSQARRGLLPDERATRRPEFAEKKAGYRRHCKFCFRPFYKVTPICPDCGNCQNCGLFHDDTYKTFCQYCGYHRSGKREDEDLPVVRKYSTLPEDLR